MKFGFVSLAFFATAIFAPAYSQNAPNSDARDKIYVATGLNGEDISEPWWNVMASCYGATMSITYIMELGSIETVEDGLSLLDVENLGDKWREIAISRLVQDRQISNDEAFEMVGIAAHEASRQLSELAGDNIDQITADILASATMMECPAAENAYYIEFDN